MKTTIVHNSFSLFFILFLGMTNGLIAQADRPSSLVKKGATKSMTGVSTNDDYSITELIQDVFIGGDCFEVSNVTFTGSAAAVGYFNNGQSSIGFDEGVILATGSIANAEGPNIAANTGDNLGAGSDADLQDIANQSIQDAAILEFDFTPTTNQVSFQYVFASEEYCEYVGQSFNDAFGFFVSGPGINGAFTNGATNAALIPNTNTNITINTVNFQTNGNYYNDNGPQGQGGSGCTSEEVNTEGVATNSLEYDGFTTVLTAVLDVIPCNTYHIKLAVGDGTDGAYDSAVFLKANSFNSGGTAVVSAEVPHTNSTLGHESCSDGYFRFTRSANSDISLDLPVHFNLSDLSTATPNLDYTSALSSPVIIPAGQNELLIPITLLLDNEEEGEETITLELEQACTCEDQFVTLSILDAKPLSIQSEDLTLCEGVDSTLAPKVDGGISGYVYQWNTGATSPNISISASDFEYIFEVEDLCGNQAIDTIIIDMKTPPQITADATEVSCADERDGGINLSIEGSAPFLYQWENNFSGKNRVQLSGGNYRVIVTDQYECQDSAAISIFEPEPIRILTTTQDVTCYGDSDGGIHFDTIVGGQPGYRFAFDGGDFQEERSFQFLPAGLFPLEIEDTYGCILDTLILVDQPEEMMLELGEDVQIELGETVNIQPLHNQDINNLLTFNWQPEICLCQDTLLQPLENTNISLIIANQNGCTAKDEMRIFVSKPRSVFFPNVFSPNGDGVNDWFYPQANENVEIIESLNIWDRWGGQIFQQNQVLPNAPSIGWNGTTRGKMLKPDVYIYHAKVRFIDGQVMDVAGDIMIQK